MNNKEKSKNILRILNRTYPKVPIPLNYKNTFTLLISVLLSAQCTDVNVNNVTKNIYPKYNHPKHFVKLGRKKIERMIKKIGIFRVKAKSILAGGQSGDPNSPHFTDQAQRYADANWKDVAYYQEDVEARAEERYNPGKRK